jgi:hypothetical protein
MVLKRGVIKLIISCYRRNPFEFQVLNINDSSSLLNSNFDFNKKVKVLTHGWLNHGDSPMPESIKEGLYFVYYGKLLQISSYCCFGNIVF